MGMRLLEFNRDTGGANPQTLAANKPPLNKVPRPVKLTPRATPARPSKVLPLKAAATPATARKPIDLEQLQQRIEVLERRIRSRTNAGTEHPASHDLDLLKQRVARLQQSVHAELWAARQREHTMLEILSRPSFKTAMLQRIELFRSKQLPAAFRWLMASARQWWQENYPQWWPAFAKAWQESLDKARGLPRK
jgi:hypothetical protein